MIKKLLLATLCLCAILLPSAAVTAHAATTTCDTYEGSNVEGQNYDYCWNEVSCTGYQLQQYKNGEWVTVKWLAMGTIEYRVSGLKSGTSYKFRIRPYYKVDGKTSYGAFSEVYTAKTK